MPRNFRQLHSDARESTNIEKSTVVDIVGGNAKMSSAPILSADNGFQFLPRIQLPGFPRKLFDHWQVDANAVGRGDQFR